MKKNRFLRIMSMTLVVCMLAATLVCGSASAEEPVTITLLYMSADANQQTMMKDYIEPEIAKRFPNVNLEIEEGGSGTTYENLVKTYNASGDLADIWWSGSSTTLATMETGTNLDLKPYLTESGFLDHYSDPTALEDASGAIYTLSPCTDQMYICVMYYNKDIFEANQIAVPTTWDEFLAACETLKNNGITPISFPGDATAASIQAFWIESIMTAVSPETVSKLLANETDWSDPACVETYARLKELMDAGYFQNGFEACDYATALDMFSTKQCAMTLAMAWANKTFDPETTGAFVIPAIGEGVTTGEYVQTWGTPYNGYAVNSQSEHIDVAIQVIETAIEMQAKFFNEQGTASGYVTGEALAEPNALLASINSYRDNATTRLKFAWSNSMDASTVAEWNTMNSTFIAGGYTPEEICTEFNKVYADNTWFD